MIRSTVCIAAFLVARIGGCGAPDTESVRTPADTGTELRLESPYDSAPTALPAPEEASQVHDVEGAPPGVPAAVGHGGEEADPDRGSLPPLPGPLGLLGETGGVNLLDLPQDGETGRDGVIVTPEPATLLLAGAGLVLGALWRRRKRRRAQAA